MLFHVSYPVQSAILACVSCLETAHSCANLPQLEALQHLILFIDGGSHLAQLGLWKFVLDLADWTTALRGDCSDIVVP